MHKPVLGLLIGVSVLLILAGCSRSDAQDTAATIAAFNFTICQEPRPEICYEIYSPVCAILDSQERVEYANDCTACADARVAGFVPGLCR